MASLFSVRLCAASIFVFLSPQFISFSLSVCCFCNSWFADCQCTDSLNSTLSIARRKSVLQCKFCLSCLSFSWVRCLTSTVYLSQRYMQSSLSDSEIQRLKLWPPECDQQAAPRQYDSRQVAVDGKHTLLALLGGSFRLHDDPQTHFTWTLVFSKFVFHR